MKTTQKQFVLIMLKMKKWVTIPDFLHAGIVRYGAHIHKLRKEGHTIEMRSKYVPHKIRGVSRQVSYHLAS